jgi:hypothetical protein
MCLSCVYETLTPLDTIDVTPETRAEADLYRAKTGSKN